MTEDLTKRLELAYQQCLNRLAPLFGLEAEFSSGIVEITEEQFHSMGYFFKGKYVSGDVIEPQSPKASDSFDIGYNCGGVLYQIKNPSIQDEMYLRVKKQVSPKSVKREFNDGYSALDFVTLEKIIMGLCGFANRNFTENLGPSPVAQSEAYFEQFLSDCGINPPVLTQVYDSLLTTDLFSVKISAQLYQRKGYRVITELAPLSFVQARERITEILGPDIFKKWTEL